MSVTINLIPFFIGLTIALAGAFIIGWNLSVRRWYNKQLDLVEHNKAQQKAIDELAARMENDEMRTAIDLGKEAIINEIDTLIAEARQELRAKS